MFFKVWPLLAGIFVAVVLVTAPVIGHGHARHSVDCIFGIKGVQVQIRDLADGVQLTMMSEDEEAIARLQKRAWEEVEPEDGTRTHDCFLHMASVQVLVKEVHNGVILTVTSIDDETIVKIQEMARRETKRCRHDGHHEWHH
jgi:hypothetical protein